MRKGRVGASTEWTDTVGMLTIGRFPRYGKRLKKPSESQTGHPQKPNYEDRIDKHWEDKYSESAETAGTL